MNKTGNRIYYEIIGTGFLIFFIKECLGLPWNISMISLFCISFGVGGLSLSEQKISYLEKKWALPLVFCLAGSSLMSLFEMDQQGFSQWFSLLAEQLNLMWQGTGISCFVFDVLLIVFLDRIVFEKNKYASIGTGAAGLLLLFLHITLPLNLVLTFAACIAYFPGNICCNKLKGNLLYLERIGNHLPLYAIAFSIDVIFSMAYKFGNPYISMILRFVMLVFNGEMVCYFWHSFICFDEEDERFYEKVRSIVSAHQALYERCFYVLFGLVFAFLFYKSTTFEALVNDLGYGRKLTLLNEMIGLLLLFYAGLTVLLTSSKKKIFFMYVLLLTGQIIWHTSWVLEIAMLCIAVVAAFGKSSRILTREAVVIGLVFMLVSWVCAKKGWIINVLMWPTHESLGIIYYTDCMAHWSFLYMLSFLAWPRRMTWWRAALYIGLIQVLFHFTGARTGWVCMMLFTILMFFLDLFFKDKDKLFCHKKMMNIAYLIFIVGVLVSFGLVFVFGNKEEGETFLKGTMLIRQQLALMGLQKYPMHLFGNVIPEVGGGMGLPDSITPYFFLDCSYIRMSLMYGLVFFTCLIYIMTALAGRALKTKNLALLVMLVVVAIECISEHHMSDMTYNLLPVLYFMNWDLLKQGISGSEVKSQV